MVSTPLALGLTVGTLLAVTILGLWYARGRVRSVEDFIAARNSTSGAATTATVLASVMGAWILFAPAEAGAAFGGLPAIFGYALGSSLPLLLFVPVGSRIREVLPAGHSLTEFAYARYGAAMYSFVLLVSVFYMFIFLAAEMTGIAGALSLVAGIPQWQTALLVGGFVLVYTAYGGLVASIFTDTIQTLVILPLLAVGFGAALLALGGTGTVHSTATATDPALLDPGFRPGIEFGIYVAFAILGANMLNQGMWQRVWAADGERSLRFGFGIAAVVVIPMVLLSGLFGVAAAGFGLVDGNASIAFFLVVAESFPEWVTFLVVVLVVLLVMSSADTMFNAIASVVTADLARLLEDTDQRTLGLAGRGLTVAVAVGAIAIGTQGYSVLELFLTADLLAAAVFVPFLAGLYSGRLSGRGALAASVAGLAVGSAYFPLFRPPLATAGIDAPLPEPSFLVAFVGATAVSAAVTVLAERTGAADVDLGTLDRKIRTLDDPIADGGEPIEGRRASSGTETSDGGEPIEGREASEGAEPSAGGSPERTEGER